MSALVLYYSRSGNTRALAETIAEAAGVKADTLPIKFLNTILAL